MDVLIRAFAPVRPYYCGVKSTVFQRDGFGRLQEDKLGGKDGFPVHERNSELAHPRIRGKFQGTSSK